MQLGQALVIMAGATRMTLSLDIANLERLYASGAATPEEVVRDGLCAHPGARRSARTGSRSSARMLPWPRRAARRMGPLYGIPFAVKDNIDVAGLPTTCACPDFAYTAERSATVVERLEQAGAIAASARPTSTSSPPA